MFTETKALEPMIFDGIERCVDSEESHDLD
jgi:hypothetical protein